MLPNDPGSVDPGSVDPVPIDPTANERTALWTELSARPAASLRPASLVSPQPLRPLPGPLLAKLEVRRRNGLDAVSADHPRRERVQTIVVAPLIVAAVAGVLTIIGFASGHHLLGFVALALTVLDLAYAVAGRVWIQSDPLRITADERRLLSQAGSWQSSQDWTALASAPERAIVAAAVEAVAAIATDPAWTSGYLDGHRLAFDLAAELDSIDAQAHTVAQARVAGGAGPDVLAAGNVALDRVLALRRYRAGLVELTAHIASTDAQVHAAPMIGELRGSVDVGRYSAEGIGRLTDELTVITMSIDATAAELRRDQP